MASTRSPGERGDARASRQTAGSPTAARGRTAAAALPLRERVGALKYLPPLFRLVWATSPLLTAASVTLRLVRAFVPVAMLYVGKLVVDEVVRVAAVGELSGAFALAAWTSGPLAYLAALLLAEFGLALLSDLLSRATALCDSLLGDLFTNETSVRLMEHAAALDLAHFEDADFYDKLERARRQTTGRMVLLSQVFGQAQDVITVATLGVGLVAYAPALLLLLALALVPAFLGEAHFNAQSYSLTYAWTPERRELDYLRHAGASDETAKEVKVFGLNRYLTDRYRALADQFYAANRTLAVRRASWGALLSAVGSLGYYAAYAAILYRTATGAFSLGDLTFLAGSFQRMRSLLEGLLSSFSSVAGQALYLADLFEFFDIEPSVVSVPGARPVPEPIREGFVFEDVGFRYPGSASWAVRGLSFTLRAGEALALVGGEVAGAAGPRAAVRTGVEQHERRRDRDVVALDEAVHGQHERGVGGGAEGGRRARALVAEHEGRRDREVVALDGHGPRADVQRGDGEPARARLGEVGLGRRPRRDGEPRRGPAARAPRRADRLGVRPAGRGRLGDGRRLAAEPDEVRRAVAEALGAPEDRVDVAGVGEPVEHGHEAERAHGGDGGDARLPRGADVRPEHAADVGRGVGVAVHADGVGVREGHAERREREHGRNGRP